MVSRSHRVTFGISGGGPDSEFAAPQIALGHRQVWKEVPGVLSDTVLEYPGIGSVRFCADWREVIRYLAANGEEWGDIAGESQESLFPDDPPAYPDGLLPAPALNIEVALPESCSGLSSYLVESYVYTVFLALNLAAPAAAEFWGVSVECERKNMTHEIFLSGGLLGDGWFSALETGWPPISALSLRSTFGWLKKYRLTATQLSSSATQRALYSLLYFCSRGSPFDVTKIIWVTHALESLTATPVERVCKLLQERIFLVLGEPKNGSKRVRQRFNGFYNLRSRIVHGDFDVAHPTANELWEPRIDEQMSKLLDQYAFGASILVAILQTIIQNDWKEIHYEERLTGESWP